MKIVFLLFSFLLTGTLSKPAKQNAVDWALVNQGVKSMLSISYTTAEKVKAIALNADKSIGDLVKQYVDQGVARAKPIASDAAVQIVLQTLKPEQALTYLKNLNTVYEETFRNAVSTLTRLPHKIFFEIVVLLDNKMHKECADLAKVVHSLLQGNDAES